MRSLINRIVLGLSMLVNGLAYSEGAPLTVAIDNFSPPFTMRGANNQFYGFDVDLTTSICKQLNRSCVYKPMSFGKVLNAIYNKEADIGVGAIIITTERAVIVNFSTPYLMSQSMFIGNKNKVNQKFTLEDVKNNPVGAQMGTIYPQLLASIGIEAENITLYNEPETLIEALELGKINYALLDAPSAMYWQSQSSNTLVVLGEPFVYGFGLGVAVRQDNLTLLSQINQAIHVYQESPDYQQSYKQYLSYF